MIRATVPVVRSLWVAAVTAAGFQFATAQETLTAGATESNSAKQAHAPAVVTNGLAAPQVRPVEPGPSVEAAAAAAQPPRTASGDWEVGTRFTHFQLLDNTRGTRYHGSFVGTITEIQEEQDDWPNKFFLQYRLLKSPVWLGVSYDHVRAKTWDGEGTDGSVDLQGVVPYLQGQWENQTPVTPYAEAGFAFYQSKFDATARWARDGLARIDLKDTTGYEFSGGTVIALWRGLSADLYAQYMHVEDVTGTFVFGPNSPEPVIFTMSHVSLGIGLRYRF